MDFHQQKRICAKCDATNSASTILTSQTVENWKGLVKPEKMIDTSKVPILKNGSSHTLKGTTIDSKLVSLINTCAFDSIFQIFLAACIERENLLKFVQINENIPFLRMVSANINKKFSLLTYKDRTIILKNIFGNARESSGAALIDCNTTALYMFMQLMADCTVMKERHICDHCTASKIFSTSMCFINEIQINSKTDLVYESLSKKRRCSEPNCIGYTFKLIEDSGAFIAFEPYVADGTDLKIKICNITQTIIIVVKGVKVFYTLLGCINFHPPLNIDKECINTIGHFTALYRTKQGLWVEYDDLKNASNHIKYDYLAQPHLIIYGKI